MKILNFLALLLLICHLSFGQNYTFTNTGNAHTSPYGDKSWNWDTAQYKKFVYYSPAGDNYSMPYRLLSPPTIDASKKYPLFIMLHGAGEGIGGDCDKAMGTNVCQLIWGGKIALDSMNKYPSFVFFPQTYGGYWGNNGVDNGFYGYSDPMAPPTRVLFEIIDNVLLQNYNIDMDRIYVAGLSAGGRAAWEVLERRPELFAAATPFSGMGNTNLGKSLVNNPIWNFQGGMDDNPAPWETQNMYDSLVNNGGSPKRSLYVDRDHWSWVDAYQSKTWMQWVYGQDKKNIHVLFNKSTTICPTDSVSFGVSDGYLQYQWKKEGIDIPGATKYIYTATIPGVYTVVAKRKNGSFMNSNPLVIINKNCGIVSQNAPSAFAGPDINVNLPATSLTVTGKGTDIDGTISSYLWTKVSGPAVTMAGATSTNLILTDLQAGNYVFRLQVTDNSGLTGVDDVNIITAVPNMLPSAMAGPDVVITLPANTATLTGSGSDKDGTIVSYSWTQVTGPGATLTNAKTSILSLSALIVGTYNFRLTVLDNSGAFASDEVVVTVNPGNNGLNYTYYEGNFNNLPNFTALIPKKTGTVSNYSLVPRLKETQYAFKYDGYINITTAGQYTFFTSSDDGSKLYIGGQQVVNNDYLQATTERSGTITLTPGKQAISVTYFQQGGGQVLEVRYQGPGITKQLIPSSALFLTLPPNVLPMVNAGLDQTITLPLNTIKIAGSATDSDGSITSYSWTKITGPSAVLANANTANLGLSGLVAGVYNFRLTATDNSNGVSSDDVLLTVNPANQNPIANAGKDVVLTLPFNSVTLNGTGVDADGTITGYSWSKISGPAAILTGAASENLSLSGLLAGTYVFRLTVTDNSSNIATDDVIVLVNPVANQLPIAYAGNDTLINTITNSITLFGSGTDADGSIVSYAWSKISGPSAQLTGVFSRALVIGSFSNGNYVFRLTVTDDRGGVNSDDVTMFSTVSSNLPPTVNAGKDTIITLTSGILNLTGLASDLDGNVSTYLWSKISGATVTMTNTSSPMLSLSNLVAGTYVFRLTATDNLGLTNFDDVTVLVNAPASTCNFGTPLKTALPNINTSFTKVYVLGQGGPNLSNISNFTINWNLLQKGLYSLSFNTNNGVPNWYLDLRNLNTNTFSSIGPTITISKSGIAGFDHTYYVGISNGSLVMVEITGKFTIYFSNSFTPPVCGSARMGVEEYTIDMEVSPNPAHHSVDVQLHETEGATISVINEYGHAFHLPVVMNAAHAQVDVSSLSPGIYHLMVKQHNKVGIKKIVIIK